jgi:hypothetical protein
MFPFLLKSAGIDTDADIDTEVPENYDSYSRTPPPFLSNTNAAIDNHIAEANTTGA